jgi:hypothetical protein
MEGRKFSPRGVLKPLDDTKDFLSVPIKWPRVVVLLISYQVESFFNLVWIFLEGKQITTKKPQQILKNHRSLDK